MGRFYFLVPIPDITLPHVSSVYLGRHDSDLTVLNISSDFCPLISRYMEGEYCLVGEGACHHLDLSTHASRVWVLPDEALSMLWLLNRTVPCQCLQTMSGCICALQVFSLQSECPKWNHFFFTQLFFKSSTKAVALLCVCGKKCVFSWAFPWQQLQFPESFPWCWNSPLCPPHCRLSLKKTFLK